MTRGKEDKMAHDHRVPATGLLVLQVVLKIIKHCQEEGAGGADMVQGVLLGLVEGPRLEVTNCFPFPSRHGDEEEFDEGTLAGLWTFYFVTQLFRCVFS